MSWVDLGIQSTVIWLVENQLPFKMTSEPEGWILGSDWGLQAFTTYWIKRLEMIMTKDTKWILLVLRNATKMQAHNCRAIAGRGLPKDQITSQCILWIIWTMREERILGKCEELSVGGIHVAKNCKAVNTKDSRNIQSISGYLVIATTIGSEVMDDKCM